MSIGENLKHILHDRWMTQKELAELSGVSPEHISGLITGRRSNPSVELTKKLADALGMTVDELIKDRKSEA